MTPPSPPLTFPQILLAQAPTSAGICSLRPLNPFWNEASGVWDLTLQANTELNVRPLGTSGTGWQQYLAPAIAWDKGTDDEGVLRVVNRTAAVNRSWVCVEFDSSLMPVAYQDMAISTTSQSLPPQLEPVSMIITEGRPSIVYNDLFTSRDETCICQLIPATSSATGPTWKAVKASMYGPAPTIQRLSVTNVVRPSFAYVPGSRAVHIVSAYIDTSTTTTTASQLIIKSMSVDNFARSASDSSRAWHTCMVNGLFGQVPYSAVSSLIVQGTGTPTSPISQTAPLLHCFYKTGARANGLAFSHCTIPLQSEASGRYGALSVTPGAFAVSATSSNSELWFHDPPSSRLGGANMNGGNNDWQAPAVVQVGQRYPLPNQPGKYGIRTGVYVFFVCEIETSPNTWSPAVAWMSTNVGTDGSLASRWYQSLKAIKIADVRAEITATVAPSQWVTGSDTTASDTITLGPAPS